MKTISLENSLYDIDSIVTWCYLNLGNGARFGSVYDVDQYPDYKWGYVMYFISTDFIFRFEEDYIKFMLTWC